MTNEQRYYFELLHKDRIENAKTLEKPSLRGIKNSVVEKYSDEAHFIYELLQNADDAEATQVAFILYEDRLIFKHNGKKLFYVSNPEKEEEDTLNGTLCDINAITSVANSNKGQASIGKFGVGFKAVFQYTQSPIIYDSNIAFKIERFIVPTLVDEDFPGRKQNETVFVFPFNHENLSAKEAYEDIDYKLRKLVYPNLFLKNIEDISFEIGNAIGLYEKTVLEERIQDSVLVQKLDLQYNVGEDIVSDKLWLFSRTDENHRDYCVGFFIDEDEKLVPVSYPAFCFLPTKEVTNLNFIIHAPFLLTDSREGIKANEEYNKKRISLLADLSAEALICLKDIGVETGTRLIDDKIVDIVPIDRYAVYSPNERDNLNFSQNV